MTFYRIYAHFPNTLDKSIQVIAIETWVKPTDAINVACQFSIFYFSGIA